MLTCFSEFQQIQREEPLNLPPKPPLKRNWRGSLVAPFAGNTMLVLYACHGNDSTETMSSEDHRNKYFVQVLHNEIPVPIPVRLIGSNFHFLLSFLTVNFLPLYVACWVICFYHIE